MNEEYCSLRRRDAREEKGSRRGAETLEEKGSRRDARGILLAEAQRR
jgi:hypothetical protein